MEGNRIVTSQTMKAMSPASTHPFLSLDFLSGIPKMFQKCVEATKFKERDAATSDLLKMEGSYPRFEAMLEKQIQAWRENPTWVDCDPQIEVTVPKGSLCNLNVKFEVALPPEAVYNIITDPDNKKVFKNIQEVIARKVLVDEGPRQLVEVEQAASWRFLSWSGVFSVHVLVDQDRENHRVRFKQGKSGFMKRFEGSWELKPLFVDDLMCLPCKPNLYSDYEQCTGGKGRVGSIVTLQQLIEPTFIPPPPISWYLRGITAKTTETLIHDLSAEAARIRKSDNSRSSHNHTPQELATQDCTSNREISELKVRWKKQRTARLLRRR